MELEEMKRAWAAMDLRQDGMEALLRSEIRRRRLDDTRSSLRWIIAVRAVELLAWGAFTIFVASFWVANRDVLHWLVIGLLLHVYGVAGIWSTATQLLLLTGIALFDAPVVVLQRRLAQLRRFRALSTLALGLPWWWLWLLVPMVGAYHWTGVDWFAAGADWIWACMAVGLVGILASLWLARRLERRAIASPWARRIVDDVSGCSLLRASRQLDELADFERG